MEFIDMAYYLSPFGELILGSYKSSLCLCDWKYRNKRQAIDFRIQKYFQAQYRQQPSEIIDNTAIQLGEYFKGQRTAFDIPLSFAGSIFQKKVWEALLKIPYGKTISYLGLSEQLGSPEAVRAVASANGANAISVIVPCHRVIGSGGELTGYAGGLNTKKSLLWLEGAFGGEQLELF